MKKQQTVELYQQGIPVWKICARIGITPPTVYAWLREAGVQRDRKRKLEPSPNA